MAGFENGACGRSAAASKIQEAWGAAQRILGALSK
jgi:hypothetical protein